MGKRVKIQVLGPLTITRDVVDITPTAPKQRQLLALLAVRANETVGTGQITAELWDHAPPPSATAAVHTYVMQLRKILHAPNDADRIGTTEFGYRLRVRTGELDLQRFTDITTARQLGLADRDADTTRRELRRALSLWRGAMLADVWTGPLLTEAVERAERLRSETLTAAIEAELELGRHHDVLGELSGLVQGEPGNERMARLLILALYRSGRQADAIAVFAGLRRALARDHRTVPTRDTERLYRWILAGDPGLEIPVPRLTIDVAMRI
jgi:DNA-binding SARP family transcriptional activator